MRYFEFDDGKSYKFWQIDHQGTSFTVTYGKIGTAGQEKTSDFPTEDLATKEMNKLIAEKTKKGYVEKATASEKKITKRITVTYDEAEEGKTLLDKLGTFLSSPQALEVESLVIGSWEESYDTSPQEALDLLAESASKLPGLKELFVGDMNSEECEISWINQGDYTGILEAFPQLERLHIKGSSGLILSTDPLAHSHLKSITIECGGLPKDVLDVILQAKLPELEHLMLYLGVEDYGFDGSLDDLKPLFEKGRFPKLTYLGLVDSEIADEVAVAIAKAPVLEQLETLDLSQGTLTDEGAQALLDSPQVKNLKRLDLHYHYLSNAMVAKFKTLPLIVDLRDQQDPGEDGEDRYPAVTE